MAFTLLSCGGSKKNEASSNEVVTIKYWSFPNFTSDSEFTKPEEFDAALIKAFEEKIQILKSNIKKLILQMDLLKLKQLFNQIQHQT